MTISAFLNAYAAVVRPLFQPMVETLARVFVILGPAPLKPDAAGLRVRPVFRDRCGRMER